MTRTQPGQILPKNMEMMPVEGPHLQVQLTHLLPSTPQSKTRPPSTPQYPSPVSKSKKSTEVKFQMITTTDSINTVSQTLTRISCRWFSCATASLLWTRTVFSKGGSTRLSAIKAYTSALKQVLFWKNWAIILMWPTHRGCVGPLIRLILFWSKWASSGKPECSSHGASTSDIMGTCRVRVSKRR